MKKKYPGVETIDFSKIKKGSSVTERLKLMTEGNRGPDVAIDCTAGEYAKSWTHYFEMLLGLETDTSDMVNEMITSTRNFGRCGLTGVYVGFVSCISAVLAGGHDITSRLLYIRPTTSTLVLSWNVVFVLSAMVRLQCTCIGRTY
jgi:threonine dehydrogenase-like Zn-dependent dehydrogenase